MTMSGKSRKFDVKPVHAKDLRPICDGAMAVAGEVEDDEEHQAAYFEEAMRLSLLRLPVHGEHLGLRSLLAYLIVACDNDDETLQHLGLIINGPQDGQYLMTEPLLEAIAKCNLRAQYRNGNVRLLYNTRPIFMDAQRLMAASPMALPADATKAPHLPVPAPAAPSSGRSGPLGWLSRLTKGGMKIHPYQPDLKEFPQFVELMKAREEILPEIPEPDRHRFSVVPWPENHPERAQVNALAMALTVMKPEERGVITTTLELGPWSLYPQLCKMDNWSYPDFYQAVIRNPVSASLPCAHGRLPASYVARYGSVAELAAVLDLCPEATAVTDMGGRPLIADLFNAGDQRPKVRLLIDRGADPNGLMPSSKSVFLQCLHSGYYEVALGLLEGGYKIERDPSMDRRGIAAALDTPGLPKILRQYLIQHRNRVPEITELSRFTDDLLADGLKARDRLIEGIKETTDHRSRLARLLS